MTDLEKHRQDIMTPLRRRGRELDEDTAWSFIKTAVARSTNRLVETDPNGTKRRDLYNDLTKKMADVSDMLRAINADRDMRLPMGEASEHAEVVEEDGEDGEVEYIQFDEDEIAKELTAAIKEFNRLKEWVQGARRFAEAHVITQRPTSTATRQLLRLTWELAGVWKRFTGREPGLSNKADEPSPFGRFVLAVARAMDLLPTIGQVNEAIRRLKRDQPPLHDQTTEEVFGDAVVRLAKLD